VLNEYFRNKICERGLDSSGSGLGSFASCCEHSSEMFGSAQGAEFFD
jgi:hypothetical protein